MAQVVAADYSVRLAETEEDLQCAQRLRYQVFVQELGGGTSTADHTAGLERDTLDPFFDHLLLMDKTGTVVGVYRVMRQEQAERAGGFYSEAEYDLSVLKNSGRRLLELGRSCLRQDHRGGAGMHHLWTALGEYVAQHEIDVLFGVASFHGTNVQALAQPLSFLHHRHLAAPELRARAQPEVFQNMDLVAEPQLDRRAAMMAIPSLIKAYLRLGGCVGEGAFVDREFNTTDVCLILDTAQMPDRQAKLYGR